jgi:hypothetical protein
MDSFSRKTALFVDGQLNGRRICLPTVMLGDIENMISSKVVVIPLKYRVSFDIKGFLDRLK